MKCIYVHLSAELFPFGNEFDSNEFTTSSLPEYAHKSINQSKFYLKEDPLVITNEDLSQDEIQELTNFFNFCKSKFPSFYKNKFWFLTLARLLIVYIKCKKLNIEKFIHLEYDNLIYSDMRELDSLDAGIYFTRVGPFCSSSGIMFCNSITSFEKFINVLISLINSGEKNVRRLTSYDHLSEMIMIDIIERKVKDVVKYLPILPFDFKQDGFDSLGVLFDGASYGQYLGGTLTDASGWHGLHHFIGHAVANNKITIEFNKAPKVKYENKEYRVLNLHIHSKKLDNFCTYED